METDAFHHRLGKHPTIDMILHSLPVVSEDKIPKAGKNVKLDRYSSFSPNEVCADETEAIIIENRNHRKLIHALRRFTYESNIGFWYSTNITNGKKDKMPTMDNSHVLRGDVVATWDESNRSGVSSIS